MLSSKDANFVGYTYKNFEIVNEDHIPGIDSLTINAYLNAAELKKKTTKPKRPSIRTLFDTPDTPDPPTLGSFLNLLPTQPEDSEDTEMLPESARPAKYQDKPVRR
ncbi:hypothetical protein CJ030_MR2G013607 [Morella rubra]|uniref:Uncharacterized protein n=1 Tax=Morella rubra TaxID=262757 RepID=A0A6A1WDG8_9ROSI|nr:hypothetical protein CJ030_MR2G013607 [Morella rubra]